MNLAALLEAILAITPQLFALFQSQTAGATVTDAQVQALFTAYGVEEAIAAQLVATLKAAGK